MKDEEMIDNRYVCKYCYYCRCCEDTVGGAVCMFDIHDWIPDVNNYSCTAFDYDDTFERG